MDKRDNQVDLIIKTIKSSKICAIIIVASIAMIGLGSLTDSIDKVVKFRHSYMSKAPEEKTSAESLPLSSKTIANQNSIISIVVVSICIVSLVLSLFTLYIRWGKNGLSLEIDHNLKLLHDFWEEKQGYLNKPHSLSEAIRGAQQIVVSKAESSITTASIDSIEHDIDLPQWRRKKFDKPASLCGLSAKEKQGARQVYDNLGQITSKYEKIKELGIKVVRRTNLDEKFESLVNEVLNQGNPLKPT